MKTQTKIQVLQENMDRKKILKVFDRFAQSYHSFQRVHSVFPPPPPGIGGEWFLCREPGRGKLLNLKSQGGDTFRGEMILGSQAGGNYFIMTNCWYFHKMLHLEFYKFRMRRYLIFLNDSWTLLLLLCICNCIWYLTINI